MDRIILDSALLANFGGLSDPVEVCDESGKRIGYFTPVAALDHYRTAQPPISRDEIERRKRNLTGRPLRDILADLEKRA
ncbi:MAG: hypothetical protein KY475_04955 [Planctomycetes bacterium]|nr:hypothetical protein [Planctomycetota bacterium]